MAESTITTKGQCVVPKKIRDYMHLNPGDKIDFVIREDGEVFVRPVILDVRELKGQMKKIGRRPVSIKEMEKAVRKRAGKSR
ncbi:MAG: type II toxin-antitoxin system PrlF family antitoxin [Candidatus Aminicenantes bacterium]|nr:type II toxin-antitoxin system PrlF family antitoxin [Candidatus Aminicenantes bacterium]